jgi:hypothetical protein
MIVTDASQCHEEAGNYIKAEALAIEAMREMALKDWDWNELQKILQLTPYAADTDSPMKYILKLLGIYETYQHAFFFCGSTMIRRITNYGRHMSSYNCSCFVQVVLWIRQGALI